MGRPGNSSLDEMKQDIEEWDEREEYLIYVEKIALIAEGKTDHSEN